MGYLVRRSGFLTLEAYNDLLKWSNGTGIYIVGKPWHSGFQNMFQILCSTTATLSKWHFSKPIESLKIGDICYGTCFKFSVAPLLLGCGRNTPCGVKCADKAYKAYKAYKLIICGVRTEYPMWGVDKAYKLISCGVRTEYPMWGKMCGQDL